jgi:capsular polysaccharide biosynthesis protein
MPGGPYGSFGPIGLFDLLFGSRRPAGEKGRPAATQQAAVSPALEGGAANRPYPREPPQPALHPEPVIPASPVASPVVEYRDVSVPGIIWRRSIWIVLFAALVAAAAFYGARLFPSTYSSAATVQVSLQQSTGVPNETLIAANQLAAQYSQLATSNAVLKTAAAGLHVSVNALAGAVSASPIGQVNLISVSSTGDTPSESQKRADAVARALTANLIATNRLRSNSFMRQATGPIVGVNRQIASLQAEIAKGIKALSGPLTVDARSSALTILTGQQQTLAALESQRSQVLSRLAEEAALGRPTVVVVKAASPGSRTQPKPLVYGIVGGVAGFIVAAQLFVLAAQRKQRWLVAREAPTGR